LETPRQLNRASIALENPTVVAVVISARSRKKQLQLAGILLEIIVHARPCLSGDSRSVFRLAEQ
jgi:hypothetical protein